MFFEIAAVAAVIIFAILAVYIIRTLVCLQRTLRRVELLIVDTDCKIRQLESTFQTVSHLGDICEEKTARLKQLYLDKKEQENLNENYAEDLAEWLVASLKLSAKFIRRK